MDAPREGEGSVSTRRVVGTLGLAVIALGVFGACSLVQSLDYLQADLGKDAGSLDDAGDAGVDAATGIVVAGDQTSPDQLVQDATSLYWLAGIDLVTVPKAGGAPRKLATVQDAVALAADPGTTGNLYLAVKQSVVSVPKAGGAPLPVFNVQGPTTLLTSTVATDDDSIFVLEVDDNDAVGSVRRMQKDGGAAQVVSADGGAPYSLVADSRAAVWYDDTAASFFSLARGAAPPATGISLGAGVPVINTTSRQIAMDTDTIYFVDVDDLDKTVIRSRKRDPSGSAVTIFRGTTEDLPSIAVAGSFVYAVETVANAVVRVPKAGGSLEVVVSGLDKPTSVVADDAFIYFAESAIANKGSIRKLPLPK